MKLNEYEVRHMEAIRRAAPDCMVLLKSDGTFPLDGPCSLALYGSGARHTFKGGTGSGDVNVRYFVTAEEGFEKAGFNVTTKEWLAAYDDIREKAKTAYAEEMKRQAAQRGLPPAMLLSLGEAMPEPEYDLPLDGVGEACVYVLSRISGEGADRRAIPGDYFLTKTEIRDILRLNERFEQFILVLNVCGPVDLTPVMAVRNILLLSLPGMAVGDALADVVLGKAVPSGRLAATWAPWEAWGDLDFGHQDDTIYREGLLVGYRRFDTRGMKPLFPFGYGLNYTCFEHDFSPVVIDDTKITIQAKVRNVGGFPGRETVQVYTSFPEGKLFQPYQILTGFAKTSLLQPGEIGKVSVSFDLRDFASFDDTQSARVLESGTYVFRVGIHSRDTRICGEMRLERDIQLEVLDHIGLPEQEIPFASRPEMSESLRQIVSVLSDEELVWLCTGGYQGQGSQEIIGNAGTEVAGSAGETTRMLASKGIPTLIMADGPAGLRLTPHYTVDEQGVHSLDNDLQNAASDFFGGSSQEDGGESTKTAAVVHEQYCSAIPVGTALAQSFDPPLAEAMGDLVGEEMERFYVSLWLAPALNLQRHPLCGRNFEYYSEDPLLSGKMAAAMVRGVEKHPGCGTVIKHLWCNNQETNRFRTNSVVDERPLRDLYLRGFEIVIREAHPAAVMTSYNLLNGVHTAERRDMNVTVLRKEWHYDGLIMSDWISDLVAAMFKSESKYPFASAARSIRGGNDLIMPGTEADHQGILKALRGEDPRCALTRQDLEECAASILHTISRLKPGCPEL